MLKRKGIILSLALTAGLLITACSPGGKVENLGKVADKNCLCCVEDQIKPDRFIAQLVQRSNKAKTIKLKINAGSELVRFNDKTKVKGAPDVRSIPMKSCLIVDFSKSGEEYTATAIEALKPIGERVAEYQVPTSYMKKKISSIPPDTSKFLLVDARPAKAYLAGTIPGAINIPYPELRKAKDKTALLGKDKDKEIIFFCGGTHCNLAPGSTLLAKKAGYKNLKLYHAGFPGWKKAGNVSCMQVKGFKGMMKKRLSMVLVDVRPNAKGEHIPNAVNITTAKLPAWKAKFPKDKSAPIILYGNSYSCMKQSKDSVNVASAAQTIVGWGYKSVFILNSGIEGYKKAQGMVVSNKLKTNINYVKRLAPGQISAKDFVAMQKSLGSDSIIVDARDGNEFAADHIPGAINIPANDMTKNDLAKIANYNNVYVYCNTGVLAEIGYDKLTKFGKKNVKFLKARIHYEPSKVTIDEKYVIERKAEKKAASKKKAGIKVEGC